MSYGQVTIYPRTIASGASTASIVSFEKAYSKVFVEVSTMSTAAELAVFGSSDGSTFRPIFERIKTAPVQYQAVVIATTATNAISPLDFGFPYLQFRASAVVSGGVSITVYGTD